MVHGNWHHAHTRCGHGVGLSREAAAISLLGTTAAIIDPETVAEFLPLIQGRNECFPNRHVRQIYWMI